MPGFSALALNGGENDWLPIIIQKTLFTASAASASSQYRISLLLQ
jgi:hypothetical protein